MSNIISENIETMKYEEFQDFLALLCISKEFPGLSCFVRTLPLAIQKINILLAATLAAKREAYTAIVTHRYPCRRIVYNTSKSALISKYRFRYFCCRYYRYVL